MGGRIEENGGGGVGDVVLRDRGNSALSGRAADDTVLTDQSRHEVGVEVVTQECERHAGGADVLFGGVVVACEREGGLRCGAVEGDVNQMFDPRLCRSVDEPRV